MNKSTRTHIEILNEITELLKNKGFESEHFLLAKEISESSTGGEICIRCGSILLKLDEEQNINVIAEKLISEFINYCHMNGIYPKPKK